MDTIIPKTMKKLKNTYIFHIILIVIIFIFNFILISQIYWLQKAFKYLYSIGKYSYIIHIIPAIISLIFVLKNKITKKNVKIFKALTLIFCGVSIVYGFFFSALVMMNAIESPEFCKECPFNLPSSDINYFTASNENKKCNERRCAMNSEKNQNNYYEYICNYNPTSEFEEIKETDYVDATNHTLNSDNIYCIELTEEDVVNHELTNNFVSEFYDKCNSYTNFYICERSRTPNRFNLEDNFVCPEKSYITKLVIFCMLNVVINLIFGFFPWKSEYNKYNKLILYYEPRRTVGKSNSFSSTLNSSKIKKDNFEEEEDFERSPTEIIIVYGNNNNNINNNINNINNDKNNKDNQNNKKLNFLKVDEPPVQNAKNKTEIKITKNINIINNFNIINKDKESKDDNNIDNIHRTNNKNKNERNNNFEENKITISYENNITSAEKINLADKKNKDV